MAGATRPLVARARTNCRLRIIGGGTMGWAMRFSIRGKATNNATESRNKRITRVEPQPQSPPTSNP